MASNIVNVEDVAFSPAGTGATDDQAAIQKALDRAQSGILLFPDASKIYALDGFGLTIHPHTRIINAGATLLIRGQVKRESRAAAIVAGDGFQADYLRISATSSSVVNRVLSLGADTTIGRLAISSDRQQTNRPGEFGQTDDPLPAALHIRGHRTTLGYVSIERFDRAIFTRDVDRVGIQRVDIREYTTGINLHSSRFIDVGSGTFTFASGANVGDRNTKKNVEGMNGLLIQSCHFVSVSNLIVQDSIEHGIRIGGDGPTRHVTFNNCQVCRAAGCGLKVQPAAASGGSAAQIQINGLLVVDCAPNTNEAAAFDNWGRNRSGLRLENCRDIVVNGLQVSRLDKQLYSAYHGIYVAASKNVTINAPQICDTYSSGIKLSDASDNPESVRSAVNEIYIRDPSVTFLVPEAHNPQLRTHGIHIYSPVEILRNVAITGCYVRGQTRFGVYVEPFAGGVRWPMILQGWVKNEGDGVYGASAGDVDILNRLQAV
jgi:hypothetical protein